MPRGDQLSRQWNLLKMLQTRGQGLTLRELAREFEVSERTIQRDLEMLQELGVPVRYEADEIGKRYWRMPHDYFRAGPLVLTLTEAVSLHLADKLIVPLAGTHFAEGLTSVLDKIRSCIPPKAMDHFSGLDEAICVRRTGVADHSDKADIIRVLARAARERLTVEISYKAPWRRVQYKTEFDPYGLVLYQDELFAAGQSHRADDLRVFKVARIVGAKATERPFARPEGFSLEACFRSSFGIMLAKTEPIEIQVKFRGSVAAKVEEKAWHESQKLMWLDAEETLVEAHPEDAEALIATYQLTNVLEFKRWIKSLGDGAEVLSPDWLRSELREELRSAAQLYDDRNAEQRAPAKTRDGAP